MTRNNIIAAPSVLDICDKFFGANPEGGRKLVFTIQGTSSAFKVRQLEVYVYGLRGLNDSCYFVGHIIPAYDHSTQKLCVNGYFKYKDGRGWIDIAGTNI